MSWVEIELTLTILADEGRVARAVPKLRTWKVTSFCSVSNLPLFRFTQLRWWISYIKLRNYTKFPTVAVAQWLSPRPGESAIAGSTPIGWNRNCKRNNQINWRPFRNSKAQCKRPPWYSVKERDSSLSRGNARVDEDKVEVSTQTKLKEERGKKI